MQLRVLSALLVIAWAGAGVPAQTAELPWSFRPLATAEPPAASDPLWTDPIDRFVLATLHARGLQPNPPADKRTLLRRASQVLTGLPPTRAEVLEFQADDRADAFARVIDRLQASPHYGEHQARLWLDLARYSDSNGLDENLAYAEAFRYRDWVVRAGNADLPYDEFGTLQIAGDLLPADAPAALADRLQATAFLALGPKMLAEQDKDKLVLDVVDEQLDLVGRTFLGLTLGCARCHDHKFDPISQRDYYALAGIFKSTRTLANLDHVSQWLERELASDDQIALRQQREKDLAAAEQTLRQAQDAAATQQRRALVQDAGRYLLAAQQALGDAHFVEAGAAVRTSLHRDQDHWGTKACVVLHTHQAGPQFAEWAIDVGQAGSYRLEVHYATKESRPMRVLVDGQEVIGRALAEVTGDWFPAQQRWFTAGEVTLHAGSNLLRLEGLGPHVPHLHRLLLVPTGAPPGARPWPATSAWADGLLPPVIQKVAECLAAADQPLLSVFVTLAAAPSAEFTSRAGALQGQGGFAAVFLGGLPPQSLRELAERYQTLFSTAALAWDQTLAAAAAANKPPPKHLDDQNLESVRALLLDPGGWFDVPAEALLTLLETAAAQQLADLQATRDASKAAVPARAPLALCVADGKPVDLPVHIRGSHLTLAKDPVPRGFPSALAATLPAPPLPGDGSGRLELARWIFQPQNPLTPRVAVNRVWQHLFGQGLVRSPSNFGVRGELPSHPELLDWLAQTFLADGWSQKRLQRRLLLTRTWQQASDSRSDAAEIDPENRLLWRQHRRRLSAEAIRDAVLATAGTLDRTLGGSLLPTKDRDYVTNDQSANLAQYSAPRRSLYLPVIRNAMYDLFTAFDYADASVHLEQRPSTAVAPQALLLLNSPLLREQSAAFSAQVRAAAADDTARLAFAYGTAFGREPSAGELDRCRTFLAGARDPADQAAEARAWQRLCQVLLCSSEFVYVD